MNCNKFKFRGKCKYKYCQCKHYTYCKHLPKEIQKQRCYYCFHGACWHEWMYSNSTIETAIPIPVAIVVDEIPVAIAIEDDDEIDESIT